MQQTAQGLALVAVHRPDFLPFFIDWGDADHRRRIAGGKKQLLARAVGLHKRSDLHILDATGGLGRDAFTLAALGARVTLLEREPLLIALLEDARARALGDPALRASAGRIRVIHADALDFLQNGARWDVVHLDPMYPDHGGSALPQKQMQVLRDLNEGDPDADALLAPARAASFQRVVVKRPRSAPPLAQAEPDFCLSKTQARYDIYLTPP
ncbi:class I SAM-dependent methyltransferase [Sinimarinibacterium sp. NLF-5-8]|nr:class I SAM-dependent methyltransferase [Sinimarinibacterium sp. NLF-5-8]